MVYYVEMTGCLKIPYGVSVFKTLRKEGLYFANELMPTLARGTTLHQIVFQFKGSELVCIEQIAEEPMP